MRHLILATSLLAAMALAGAAQAGEGCAYSKSQTTAAAGEGAGAAGHHGGCSEICATGGAPASASCDCSQARAEAEIASRDAGGAPIVRTADGAEIAASD